MTPADLAKLSTAIMAAAKGHARCLIAISGPPGAGKSTLAAALAQTLNHAAILPMDGFHLDNETLSNRGLLHRKGAPNTFDTSAMLAVLNDVKSGGAVPVPTFDREADCVVPAGAVIDAQTQIVLVEGNYLLLDAPAWRDMHPFWDLTISLDLSKEELERRLIARWIDHGLPLADAIHRARENDIVNAEAVRTGSIAADLSIDMSSL